MRLKMATPAYNALYHEMDITRVIEAIDVKMKERQKRNQTPALSESESIVPKRTREALEYEYPFHSIIWTKGERY